jgi:hypothetical protein
VASPTLAWKQLIWVMLFLGKGKCLRVLLKVMMHGRGLYRSPSMFLVHLVVQGGHASMNVMLGEQRENKVWKAER